MKNLMRNILRDVTGRIALCGLAGTAGAALLVHLWFALTDPGAIRDGQYVFVFVLPTSLGWLVGSLAGAAQAFRSPRGVARQRRAALIAAAVVVLGTLTAPFLIPPVLFALIAANAILDFFLAPFRTTTGR